MNCQLGLAHLVVISMYEIKTSLKGTQEDMIIWELVGGFSIPWVAQCRILCEHIRTSASWGYLGHALPRI